MPIRFLAGSRGSGDASVKLLAGIVVYRPDLDRLEENVAAVLPQVDDVVVFVNGNESFDAIQPLIERHPVLHTIRSAENVGIASGLAEIMKYAEDNRYEWVLTIDQDSVCMPGLVQEYMRYVSLLNVGMLTCCITDRNFSQDSCLSADKKYREVEKCITAGSFTNVAAYAQTDGYDESMFIDAVDWDICYNLRRHGYAIYCINFDGVLQEVGHGKNVSLFGKSYISYGESPLRNYFGARNNIYLARKYPEYLSMGKTLVRELRAEVIVLLYEDSKDAKIRNRWRGIREGFSMRLPIEMQSYKNNRLDE